MKNPILITFISLCTVVTSPIAASTYYWVGNGGDWSNYSNHWATTSGGMVFYIQPPTATDDVIFDANSFTSPNQMVTLGSGFINCHSMTWTGVANNPTFGDVTNIGNMTGTTLRIYGSMTLDPAMTWGYIGKLSFESTTTGNIINSFNLNGPRDVYFNSPSGNWQLANNFTCTYLTLTSGTLKTNNYTILAGYSIEDLGSSAFTLNCGSSFFSASDHIQLTSTALTIDADSASFRTGTFQTASSQHFHKVTIQGGSLAVIGNSCLYDSVIVPNTTTTFYVACNGSTFTNISCRAPAFVYNTNTYQYASFYSDLTTDANNTFGTLALNNIGYSVYLKNGSTTTITQAIPVSGGCSGYVALQSTVSGSTATIFKSSGSIVTNNLSLRDIHTSGSATFSASNSVIISNVTGWTVTATSPRNLYWVGGSGNWSDAAHWSLSSGGVGGECMPGQVDNVFFDAQSFSASGQTLHVDVSQPACHDLNWNGENDSININNNSITTDNWSIYGSLAFVNNLNWQYAGNLVMSTSSANNAMTTAGLFLQGLVFNGTGSWYITDSIHCNSIDLQAGTLFTLGHPLHFRSFNSNTSNTRNLYLGTSVINCQDWFTAGNGMTIHADSSVCYLESLLGYVPATYNRVTFRFSPEYSSTWSHCRLEGSGLVIKTAIGADALNTYAFTLTINKCTFYEETNLNGGPTVFGEFECRKNLISTVAITADTFLLNNPGYSLTLEDGTTSTFQHLITTSSCTGYTTIQSSNTSIQATIHVPTGIVTVDYVILSGINAGGGATFNATNSVFLSNVSGWNLLSTSGGLTFYWVNGSGKWSEYQHWANSSGGTPSGCTPTLYDNVVFDTNSFVTSGDTVDIDIPNAYCNNMTWQIGPITPVVYNATATSNYNSLYIYGNLTLDTGIVWSYPGRLTMGGSGTGKTVTTAMVQLNEIYFDADTASWILTDSLSCEYLEHDHGFLNTNGKPITCDFRIQLQDSIRLGTSLISTAYINNYDSPLQFSGDSSTIHCRYFYSYIPGLQYNIVQESGNYAEFSCDSCFIRDYSALNSMYFYNSSNSHIAHAIYSDDATVDGIVTYGYAEFRGETTIKRSNTFDTLILNCPGHVITLDADSSQTINDHFARSSASSINITVNSSNSGIQALLFNNGDTACMEYMQFGDINSMGTHPVYAGIFGTDLGNNSGIYFTSCQLPMSNVWPGDANNDLTVDNNDVLNIGLAFGETGSVRSNATINWQAEPCVDWNRIFASGVNISHADCDGNGTIDSTDLAAVYQNYGLTHPAINGPYQGPVSPNSGENIFLDPAVFNYNQGDFVTIPVTLGSAADPADNIYGVAYKITYDQTKIVPGSVYMTYSSSWFTPNGNRVSFQKDFYSSGRIDDGQSRINLTNVTGYGTIAYLHFQIDPAATGQIDLNIISVSAVDKDENTIALVPVGTTIFIVPLGTSSTNPTPDLQVFPNPSNADFNISAMLYANTSVQIEIYDVTGKCVYRKEIAEQAAGEFYSGIPGNVLANGIYELRFVTDNGMLTRRLVKVE